MVGMLLLQSVMGKGEEAPAAAQGGGGRAAAK